MIKHELIDIEHINDSNLKIVKDDLDSRLAAMLAGDLSIDPVQLAKDQSIMITNMLTLVGFVSAPLCEQCQRER
ncbi:MULTISPECIES: hypothetical protein [Aeromonas]|uniref:hypothetical protein n=1 Tax=Aeromonas sobria TaxID=646 RepID=UPI0011DFF4B4|nr:hypothetical protein [Aeromonas sobria]